MFAFPLVFALTLLVEVTVLVGLHRRERPLGRIVVVSLVANVVTHPLVFLVMPRWFDGLGAYLVVAECFALLVETPILWVGLRLRPGLIALRSSALSNGASYLVGMALAFLL